MISVIIPIYNVEKYIVRCLDSLAEQTYKEVEFLLIDDGSTDRSGEIAERYTDQRFKVFHTKNRGLSAARNYGLEQAKGDWIMFVDSDDWVSPNFCEIPYKAALEYDADLVIFQSYKVESFRGLHFTRNTRNLGSPRGIVDTESAIDYGRNMVWNKLYKKCLFNEIRFPDGRYGEDMATTYKLIYYANNILLLDEKLYYYRLRKDSLSHSHIPESYRDTFIFANERYKNLVNYGYPADKAIILMINKAISFMTVQNYIGTEEYLQAELILDTLTTIPRALPWKKKAALFAWRKNKRMFNLLCDLLLSKRYCRI